MPRPSALILGLALGACAGELPRGEQPVRPGEPDALPAPDAALDAAPDAAPATDLGPPPDRAVWIIVRSDPWPDGLRAHLHPPHPATGPAGLAALDALPDTAALIRWRGAPDAAGAATLSAAWRAPRTAGVLYALGDRLAALADPGPLDAAAAAVTDASLLAAWLPAAVAPLIHAGAPLIVVDADWRAPAALDAFAAARDRLETLGVPATWAAIIEPDDPVAPADIAAAVPRCEADDPAARRRASRSLDPAVDWLPCVAAPHNPRLDRPRAVADDPAPATLARRLVLARRDGAPVIVVDGLGGWRDDRQLDPVEGPPTGAPAALTTGLVYRGYGPARLDAVRRLLRAPAGPIPTPLGDPATLIELVRSPGVIVEILEYTPDGLRVALRDAAATGRYEALLDARPFVVPEGAALRYVRTDPALAVDLVFEGGDRLADLLPEDGAAPAVIRRLDPFAGRRVEEVTLVYAGGRDRVDARIARPVVAPAP